ncbi:MAG: hypothetical protein M3414_03320 [Pseudomonadota bacterium]|nr:hypothetical protein [Pseudomonadota bacterium]
MDLADPSLLDAAEVAVIECGQQKIIEPMGWIQVKDPASLTLLEVNALLLSWSARAQIMMDTWCAVAAPDGCTRVEPIRVFDPRLSYQPAARPPYRMFLEMKLTFRCVEAA